MSSQTKIDPNNLGILSGNTSVVQYNAIHFIKSWNWWQQGKNFDEALGMNAGHDYNVKLYNS